MKSLAKRGLVSLLGVALSAGVAFADQTPQGDPGAGLGVEAAHAQENYAKADWPPAWVLRSVTVPAGGIRGGGPPLIYPRKGNVGEPGGPPLGSVSRPRDGVQGGVTS